MRVDRTTAVLLAVTALAAALRFATLADQSFWYDEALTADLTSLPFGSGALGITGQAEPPVYFALAWVWVRVFGRDEAGLRSLSALAGVLTVPVTYSAARTLVSRRAGLIAAGLVAVSPPLIVYSQEARSYALYVLLSALSLMFLGWIRERPTRGRYAAWVAVALLAVATHYFALFVLVPEALWLVARRADRRRSRLAAASLGAGLVALAPLALYQRAHGAAEWISNTPLSERLKQAWNFLLIGLQPGRLAPLLLTGAWVAACALALARGDRDRRQGTLLALAAGGAPLLLPLAAAVAGSDYVLDRNLLAAVVPLAIVLGAGLAMPALRWVGPIVAVAICAGLLVEHALAEHRDGVGRDDWRAVARALGPARGARLVGVVPGWQSLPLRWYHPRLAPLLRPARAREVVTITYQGPRPRPGPTTQPAPPPPFRLVRARTVQRMALRWFRARAATVVRPAPGVYRPGWEGPVLFRELPRQ